MLAKRKGGVREAASEGSVEQSHDPTNRNRISRQGGPDERAVDRKVHIHQEADLVDPAGVW